MVKKFRPNNVKRMILLNRAVRNAKDQNGCNLYFGFDINNFILNYLSVLDSNFIKNNVIPFIYLSQIKCLSVYQQIQQLYTGFLPSTPNFYNPNQELADKYYYKVDLKDYCIRIAENKNRFILKQRENNIQRITGANRPLLPMRQNAMPQRPYKPPNYNLPIEDVMEIACSVPLPISRNNSSFDSSSSSSELD